MRAIPLPKDLATRLQGVPEKVISDTISKFPPRTRPGEMKSFNQGYKFTKSLLLGYSDSYLQTLLRVLYEPLSPEYCYRDFLYHTIPNSRIEHRITSGIIDLVTPTQVIEVKKSQNWKHALGQALSYAFEMNLLPAVALIGSIPQIAHDTLAYYQVEIIELP